MRRQERELKTQTKTNSSFSLAIYKRLNEQYITPFLNYLEQLNTSLDVIIYLSLSRCQIYQLKNKYRYLKDFPEQNKSR